MVVIIHFCDQKRFHFSLPILSVSISILFQEAENLAPAGRLLSKTIATRNHNHHAHWLIKQWVDKLRTGFCTATAGLLSWQAAKRISSLYLWPRLSYFQLYWALLPTNVGFLTVELGTYTTPHIACYF